MALGRSGMAQVGASVLGGGGSSGGPDSAGLQDAGVRPEDEMRLLRKELDRRQAAYISREREYRTRIELLERELTKARGGPGAEVGTAPDSVDVHRKKLRDLHHSILGNIESVQDQTQRILREQERDLLRAFRAKLFNVQADLERANAKASEGASEWVERSKQLQKELEWSRETSDRLDRHNQGLLRENQRLRSQFKSQEDDREYLVRQLVAVKKDNARLRQDLAAAQEEVLSLRQEAEELRGSAAGALGAAFDTSDHHHRPASSRSGMGGGDIGESARQHEVIRRMKRLLESERRHLRQARQALAAEVQQRSEIEKCFRTTLAEVQTELASKKSKLTTPHNTSKVAPLDFIPIDELTPVDRKEILRRILQQEDVLRIIREHAFPIETTNTLAQRATATLAVEAGVKTASPSPLRTTKPTTTSSSPTPSEPEKPTKGLVILGTKKSQN